MSHLRFCRARKLARQNRARKSQVWHRSYGWDVISGNLSKSAFFEGSGSLRAQISEGRRRRPPTTVGVGKLEWLLFRVVSKCPQCMVCFCHKARVYRTDGQTDRITTPETALAQLRRAVKSCEWISMKFQRTMIRFIWSGRVCVGS